MLLNLLIVCKLSQNVLEHFFADTRPPLLHVSGPWVPDAKNSRAILKVPSSCHSPISTREERNTMDGSSDK
jgi:hypothetical protein